MAKFKVGDRVRLVSDENDHLGLIRGDVGTVAEDSTVPSVDWDRVNDRWAVLENEIEPVAVAPATAAPTVNLDLEFIPFPQVGDAVLIPGVISAINQSPRGTNYNIVFETQNRRMSLHFLEEDFILDGDGGDEGDCPCANNDNGPAPTGDTAKAFDALGDWLRSLAVERAA